VVDGFTTLAAARRALEKKGKPGTTRKKTKPTATARTPAKRAPARKTHIAKTALPSKQDIYCYECGFVFTVTGQTGKALCPKCRTMLERTNHAIDGEWEDVVKTGGTVHIKPTGVMLGGSVLANKIIIEGKVKAGSIQAFNEIEIRKGAEFPETVLQARDLTVGAGGKCRFEKKKTYRNVEVYGELEAVVFAEGAVTVHPGGRLKGEVHSSHLTVEDGASLEAQVFFETPASTD